MIAAIIQARMSSTRLPGKVLMDLNGRPFLWHVVNRLKSSKFLEKIIVATSDQRADDAIEDFCRKEKFDCFRGSEGDVLARYYEAAKHFNANIIVRITADDPFKDYQIMDATIGLLLEERLNFATNNNPATFPEGLDIEVFDFESLEKAQSEANTSFDREHVTQYFYKNPSKFHQKNISQDLDLSYLRWTVDNIEDLNMAREVYRSLSPQGERVFLTSEILELLKQRPEIAKMNADVKRSLMYQK